MKERDLKKLTEALSILNGLEYLKGSTKNDLLNHLKVEIELLEEQIERENQ